MKKNQKNNHWIIITAASLLVIVLVIVYSLSKRTKEPEMFSSEELLDQFLNQEISDSTPPNPEIINSLTAE